MDTDRAAPCGVVGFGTNRERLQNPLSIVEVSQNVEGRRSIEVTYICTSPLWPVEQLQ